MKMSVHFYSSLQFSEFTNFSAPDHSIISVVFL